VRGFIRKLLGRRAAPPHLAEALAELERLANGRPSLQASCEVLAAVLPQLFTEPAIERAPLLSPEKAREKRSGAVPLLRGESVDFDQAALHHRWLAICGAVDEHQTDDAPRALGRAVEELNPAALLAEVLAGRPEAVYARAEALSVDPSLAATVLRLSAYPALVHVAAQLADVHQCNGWDAGYCPMCGSQPLLGEVRGLEQLRFLRCGLCASAWEFPRLRCPLCDNRDHRLLGYFHVEGEENRHRAATCDACHGFVKVVSTLAPLSPVRLLIADVATLHLDLAAADRGFLVR
jgi:FdhE protein